MTTPFPMGSGAVLFLQAMSQADMQVVFMAEAARVGYPAACGGVSDYGMKEDQSERWFVRNLFGRGDLPEEDVHNRRRNVTGAGGR